MHSFLSSLVFLDQMKRQVTLCAGVLWSDVGKGLYQSCTWKWLWSKPYSLCGLHILNQSASLKEAGLNGRNAMQMLLPICHPNTVPCMWDSLINAMKPLTLINVSLDFVTVVVLFHAIFQIYVIVSHACFVLKYWVVYPLWQMSFPARTQTSSFSKFSLSFQ